MAWFELIRTQSVIILDRSDCTWLCCLLCQLMQIESAHMFKVARCVHMARAHVMSSF